MATADADTITVPSFDALWGVEVRWLNLGDLHFGPRGLARRTLIYAAVLWVLLAIVTDLPEVRELVGWLSWWAKPLVAAAVGWALSMLDIEGLRAHELLVPLALHLIAAKHYAAFRACAPVGGRWRPAPLVLLSDGSNPRLGAVRYHGPGSVERLANPEHPRRRDPRHPRPAGAPAARLVVAAGQTVRLDDTART